MSKSYPCRRCGATFTRTKGPQYHCSERCRFLSHVDQAGPVPTHRPELGPCWVWTGGVGENGYGSFNCKRANRQAWRILVGPIPPGKYVLHHCDVRLCVRPSHLWIGTHEENMVDMVAKGRAATGERSGMFLYPDLRPHMKGETNGCSKLTEDDVRTIRLLYVPRRMSCSMLGRRFGVTGSVICEIVNRRAWAHVA